MSCDICVYTYHLWLVCAFSLGAFFSSSVTEACPVTTDLTMRANVKTTTIYPLSFSPLSPYFLALAFSLASILSFTSVLYPPNFSIDSTSSWSPPKSSIFLGYVIPSHSSSPFRYFLPYSPISYMAGNLFSGILFTIYEYCHFNFLACSFVLSGHIPTVVLLLTLQYSSCLSILVYF